MFCEHLREATKADHDQAEGQPFLQALLQGRLQARDAMAMLAALLPVYEALEGELATRADDPIIGLFDHRRLDRVERMRRDLAAAGWCAPDPVPAATAAYVGAVRDAASTPARLLAHHYTRYLGDLAGGQAIATLLRRAYGIDGLATYDFTDLGDTTHYRRQYRSMLDLLPWSPVEQAEFIAEAQIGYRMSAGVFAGLAEHCGLSQAREHALAGFVRREVGHLPRGGGRRTR